MVSLEPAATTTDRCFLTTPCQPQHPNQRVRVQPPPPQPPPPPQEKTAAAAGDLPAVLSPSSPYLGWILPACRAERRDLCDLSPSSANPVLSLPSPQAQAPAEQLVPAAAAEIMNVTLLSSVTPSAGTSTPVAKDFAGWHDGGAASGLDGAEELAWWAWIVVEVGVATVIVLGDVSLLMLFFTRKLLGQSTNILVFSVAVADLMAGLFVLPLDVLQRTLGQTSGYMCKSYFYLSNVSKTAMVYTVAMLAMERIVAALSTTFRILSPGRCLFFSSITWFFAAAYNIWSVVLYDIRLVGNHPSPSHGQVSAVDGYGGGQGEVGGGSGGGGGGGGSGGGGGGGGVGGGGGGATMTEEDIRKSAVSWEMRGVMIGSNFSAHVCFTSTRFKRLVEVFVVLDFLVTFLVPVLGSVVLFSVFWKRREMLRAPGRPYRSSTSVIIFTFALLVSFIICHFPLEVAALHVQNRDVTTRREDFLAYKVCQLVSFTRGFWDVFVFGAFRHYVCRKERALAVFRETQIGSGGGGGGIEGRGGGGAGGGIEGEGGAGGGGETGAMTTSPSTCLAVPNLMARPSISLLDSDQEVTMTPHRSSISDQ